MSNPAGMIDINQLPPEQLMQLQTQQKSDIEALTQNYTLLRAALTKYNQSLEALTDMQSSKQDEHVLVPLTGSLYVPGKIKVVDKVIIELGTGYFVEKSIDSAIVLIKNKLGFLQKSLDQLTNVIVQKKKQLATVTQVIQNRVEMMQQQGQ